MYVAKLLGLVVLSAPQLHAQATQERMVQQQIEQRDITDVRVLDAMQAVPRREFVPPDLVSEAHRDSPLPIGYGLTISQPYIVAFMSEALEVKTHHRMLEIGTGSRYQAAVPSKLAARVY